MADWTDLANAAADPGAGIFGIGFDGMNSFHYYSNTARSFGAPDSIDSWVMDGEGTTLLYDQPLHGEVAAWYREMLDNRVAPRQSDYIENSPARIFIAGFNATHATTAGGINSAINQVGDAFEVAYALLPVGPEGRQGTCYSGNQHMINSRSAHIEETWDLMKMYSSGEAGTIMVLEGKLQPNGHKSAWTHPDVVAVSPVFGDMDSLLTAGIEPFPMPKNTRFTEANNVFLNEINLIWEGQTTWEEHAGNIVAMVNEVLDLPRPE
nr:hypothetical protein [uncultured bacterium]